MLLGSSCVTDEERSYDGTSTDRGERFDPLPFDDDLARAPVADLALDPVDPTLLLAATYGRGLWRLHWTTGAPACAQ